MSVPVHNPPNELLQWSNYDDDVVVAVIRDDELLPNEEDFLRKFVFTSPFLVVPVGVLY